ncbi:hypothetical protein [Streptomyces atriruber]|uniref:hypothetical protein n=1 Tax=Streptomyces atriruber TaxID=545121 RepID=UPI0006E22CFA|nr:hypothetical protein [Streptomyces atriruber]
MGLDIHLYTAAQQKQNHAWEKASEEFYDRERTDAEKAAFREQWTYTCATDVPSEKHGEGTLNNRRYLRSSYNGSGFNSAVPQVLGRESSYYWIFEGIQPDQEPEIELTEASIPALEAARGRAEEIAAELRAMEAPVKVATVGPNLFSGSAAITEDGALSWYREQVQKAQEKNSPFGENGWSNRDGHFYGGNPLEVVAAVPGVGLLGEPGVHLIFKMNDETTESYAQSADIVAEFIEEAIELIREDGAVHMHWSG